MTNTAILFYKSTVWKTALMVDMHKQKCKRCLVFHISAFHSLHLKVVRLGKFAFALLADSQQKPRQKKGANGNPEWTLKYNQSLKPARSFGFP